jgi:DsbC/DsbD-like thiol-disulfide interchange protein
MKNVVKWRWFLAIIVFMTLSGIVNVPAVGAVGLLQASPWKTLHASRVRLIPGPLLGSGDRLVGVQVQLDPGWHTYWRNPGYSGVPPRFDWSESTNLEKIFTEWPAPVGLPDAFGVSIGYQDEVVFPVRLAFHDPSKSASISLQFDYAVCAEVCVPLRAELLMNISGEASAPQDTLATVNRYRRLVPDRLNKFGKNAPTIIRSWVSGKAAPVTLYIEAKVEPPAEVFVEGPSAYFFSPAKAQRGGATEVVVFEVNVDGIASADNLIGETVNATMVSAAGSLELSWTVH